MIYSNWRRSRCSVFSSGFSFLCFCLEVCLLSVWTLRCEMLWGSGFPRAPGTTQPTSSASSHFFGRVIAGCCAASPSWSTSLVKSFQPVLFKHFLEQAEQCTHSSAQTPCTILTELFWEWWQSLWQAQVLLWACTEAEKGNHNAQTGVLCLVCMPCVHLDAATLMVHWVHSVLYGGVGKTASASPAIF